MRMAGVRSKVMPKLSNGIKKAAEKGLPESQYILGLLYETGQGVKQSDAEAFKWYKKAAEKGLPQAQLGLGRLYANGWGAKQSDAEAFKWYKKSG